MYNVTSIIIQGLIVIGRREAPHKLPVNVCIWFRRTETTEQKLQKFPVQHYMVLLWWFKAISVCDTCFTVHQRVSGSTTVRNFCVALPFLRKVGRCDLIFHSLLSHGVVCDMSDVSNVSFLFSNHSGNFEKSSLNLIMFLVTNNLTIKFPIMMQNSMLQNKLNFIYNYIWYTETQQKSASNLWLWEINSATFMYRVESSKLNLADKLTFPILIWQQKLLKQFPPQF